MKRTLRTVITGALGLSLGWGVASAPTPVWAEVAPKRAPAPRAKPFAPKTTTAPKVRPSAGASLAVGAVRSTTARGSGGARGAPSPKPAPATTGRALPAKPRSGVVGYVLADAKTGRVIETRNAQSAFIPASLAKTPTALYALAALGPDHVFVTTLWTTGEIVDGVLEGDLYLVGSGDPTLDTGDLAALVKALQALGVTAVRGRYFYDAGALPTEPQIQPGQPVHAAYNPSISGLNLNFNRVQLRWEKAPDGDYAISLFAHARTWSSPAATVEGDLLPKDDPRRVFRYRRQADGDEAWQVSRHLLTRKRGRRWLPVQEPGRYAAGVFRTVAAEHGVGLPEPRPGAAPAGATKLAASTSEPLREIVTRMLEFSTNLTAEVVGLAASRASGATRLALPLSGARMAAWVQKRYGAPAGGLDFANHSGLSSTSRATPAALNALLIGAAGADPSFPALLPPYRTKGLHKATVRAKTGTMYYGRGLSGYIECKNGRRLAFTYMHSDFARRDALDKAMDPEEIGAPRGAKVWLGRARRIERGLLQRWTKEACG